MNDECPVCGLPTHADADMAKELCRRCYWWLEEFDLQAYEEWVMRKEEKGEN
jgi:hypothetical protein